MQWKVLHVEIRISDSENKRESDVLFLNRFIYTFRESRSGLKLY